MLEFVTLRAQVRKEKRDLAVRTKVYGYYYVHAKLSIHKWAPQTYSSRTRTRKKGPPSNRQRKPKEKKGSPTLDNGDEGPALKAPLGGCSNNRYLLATRGLEEDKTAQRY